MNTKKPEQSTINVFIDAETEAVMGSVLSELERQKAEYGAKLEIGLSKAKRLAPYVLHRRWRMMRDAQIEVYEDRINDLANDLAKLHDQLKRAGKLWWWQRIEIEVPGDIYGTFTRGLIRDPTSFRYRESAIKLLIGRISEVEQTIVKYKRTVDSFRRRNYRSLCEYSYWDAGEYRTAVIEVLKQLREIVRRRTKPHWMPMEEEIRKLHEARHNVGASVVVDLSVFNTMMKLKNEAKAFLNR